MGLENETDLFCWCKVALKKKENESFEARTFMKKTSNTRHLMEQCEPYLEDLTMQQSCYIKNRLIQQIVWYDEASTKKQIKYKVLTILSIGLTATIPCLTILTNYTFGIVISILIAVLSGTSSAIISIVNLCEYQKLWVEYRTNCETLQSELYQFLTNTGRYSELDDQTSFSHLVSITEESLKKESQTWIHLNQMKAKHNK